jgi:hypothetical protein
MARGFTGMKDFIVLKVVAMREKLRLPKSDRLLIREADA